MTLMMKSPRLCLCRPLSVWRCVWLLLLLLVVMASGQNSTGTDAPTASPDDVDDDAAATDAPTASPTVVTPAPVASTPSPTTASPTPAPVASTPAPSTAEPTVPATPAPVASTPSPTTEPTTPAPTPSGATPAPTVVLEPIQQTIRGLAVTFGNVDASAVDGAALIDWEDITKQWFQDSFNGDDDSSSRRRYLQSSNPSKIGISKMRTELQVVDTLSNADDNSLTIVYDQVMRYISSFGSQSPQALAQLPFKYPDTNDALRNALRSNVQGFDLVTTISVPELQTEAPSSSPSDNDNNGNDDGFWTLPVIIGIAVGGAVVLMILACACYALGRPKSSSNSTKPSTSLNSTSRYGYGGGPPSSSLNHHSQPYQQPTANILALGSYGDDMSTLEEPHIPNVITNASGDVYGDQSVATVDYDYSKAYGGGGDTSVVSSVGGTLGDNTRFTGAEPLPSSRVALGASFESDDHGRRGNNVVREEIIEVLAPAGKLGVVIDTPDEGAPVVHAVKDSSVIADQIQVGDKLIAVDDEDVRSMTAIKVSKLISKKSAQPTRKLTLKRLVLIDDD